MDILSLEIDDLQRSYREGALTPVDTIREVYRRIRAQGQGNVWECLIPEDEALKAAQKLPKYSAESLPLYGVPFCVKDNIHVKGLPTTASCAAFSHTPDESSPVVEKLIESGAILIGKNTMDQFATGLVGVRRGGHPVNPFNSDYIPGGSSSGSAVAVATHLVSFSLGSDTGGSGRVPAALNNIVGLKPTPGLLNTAGMVYANRSFDCMPVFALTCRDAEKVFRCALATEERDPFMSDEVEPKLVSDFSANSFTIGIPDDDYLTFFGDSNAETQFAEARQRLESLGATTKPFDCRFLKEAGDLIFDGPLLAERLASIGTFLNSHPGDVHNVVKSIVEKAEKYSAVDLYGALHRLQYLKAKVATQMTGFDALMMPTTGTVYKIEDVEKDPVTLNKNMGYYTYFANPLGLSVVAVPVSIKADGLPFGISFVGKARHDMALLKLGKIWQDAIELSTGLCPGIERSVHYAAE